MNRVAVPPIKCQGIKTKLVPMIRSVAPEEIQGTWIEPFMGSGVVAFNMGFDRNILTDSNPHLIRFYSELKDGLISSRMVRSFLEEEGGKLLESDGAHYYAVRERFNDSPNSLDFLFLNRACFNGMIRFNRKGGFNVPFCKKPNRFAPAYVTKITNQVATLERTFKLFKYEFYCQDFSSTIRNAHSDDVLYCDPPYIGRHVDYFNSWDESSETTLAQLLGDFKGVFILSTWHSNRYRSNEYLHSLWGKFHVNTKEHFYHVGGKEANRNSMLEALVTNYRIHYSEPSDSRGEQISLFSSK